MTVSRVINGKKKSVSEETAERIRKIAHEMGYVPNSSARALASHSSRLVAVMLQEYDEDFDPSDRYTSIFLGQFALQLKKEGYDLMMHYVKDYSEITYSLKSWNVAGAVFIGMFDESIQKLQEDNRIPMIFTDSYSSIRSITNVGIDEMITGAGKWRQNIFLITDTGMWRFTDRKHWTMEWSCTACRDLLRHFAMRESPCRPKISLTWEWRIWERN